jgi:hypothetical protein
MLSADYVGGATLLFQKSVERGAGGIDHPYELSVFIVAEILQNQSA